MPKTPDQVCSFQSASVFSFSGPFLIPCCSRCALLFSLSPFPPYPGCPSALLAVHARGGEGIQSACAPVLLMVCVYVHQLEEVALAMRAPDTGLRVKNRTHHFRKYKSTFTGRECVTWLVE